MLNYLYEFNKGVWGVSFKVIEVLCQHQSYSVFFFPLSEEQSYTALPKRLFHYLQPSFDFHFFFYYLQPELLVL